MPHQILIADSDPGVRSGLVDFLKGKLGYGVTSVADGHAAVEAAAASRFDLFILGIDDADEAEISMRLHKLCPDSQAIYMTTDGSQEAIQDFLRFSVPNDRVLIKPLSDMSSLTKLIVGILGPPTA